MAEHQEGKEKEVTFYEGAPQEKHVPLHDTGGYVGAHKGSHGAYGVAAVTEKLKGIDFPASKQEVIDRIGDEDIQWSKDKKVNLRVIFDRMPDRLEAPTDVVKVVSDHIDEIDHQPDR